jgi:hypothetical protein
MNPIISCSLLSVHFTPFLPAAFGTVHSHIVAYIHIDYRLITYLVISITQEAVLKSADPAGS